MAELRERPQVYYIPENYIGETRVFQGQIKLWNLVQGCILALLSVIPVLMIDIENFRVRITLVIIAAAPMVIAGVMGFNGDSLWRTFQNFRAWKQNKYAKLYNTKPRILSETPFDIMLEEEAEGNFALNAYDKYQSNRYEKYHSLEFVEGENFEFRNDPHVDDYVREQMTEEEWKSYKKRLEEEKQNNEIRIVSKRNMNDFDDLVDIDILDDYSIENSL